MRNEGHNKELLQRVRKPTKFSTPSRTHCIHTYTCCRLYCSQVVQKSLRDRCPRPHKNALWTPSLQRCLLGFKRCYNEPKRLCCVYRKRCRSCKQTIREWPERFKNNATYLISARHPGRPRRRRIAITRTASKMYLYSSDRSQKILHSNVLHKEKHCSRKQFQKDQEP